MAVGAKGSLLTLPDNGMPGFIAQAVTNVATALEAHAAAFVEIINATGHDLTVDHGDGTPTATLKTGNSHVFKLLANTSELRVSIGVAGPVTLDMVEYWGGLQ